ncbi:MAG: aldo/keto reductase [Deltaproteobacteria bacterium]|nr:aldo/keto reductase [Deltaproteobacteria bacterium]
MRTRSIVGSTVTAIGCGDVSLGIAASRGVDRRELERALHEALTLGISLIDVHDEDDSERLVGDAVRTLRLRDRAVVTTRITARTSTPGFEVRDVLHEKLPAAYVQERVESSLRMTRLDVIPLAQLPVRGSWIATRGWSELRATCERLVSEGKVLGWGAIVEELEPAPRPRDPEEPIPPPAAHGLAHEPWLTALQLTYNLCDRRADSLISLALERKLVVLARRPLAGGTLAGAIGPGGRLTPRDDRNDIDPDTLDRIALHIARLAPLVRTTPPAAGSTADSRAILDRGKRPDNVEATTLAELALRYVVDRGVIALPRLHRHEHIPSLWMAMSAPPLSADVVLRILDEKSVEKS